MSKISDILYSSEMEELRKQIKESQREYKEEVEHFWDNLSYEDKLKAFYHVCSKIYEGDVIEEGTYRYVLYTKFGFYCDSYAIGMDCNYIEIHNLLSEGLEYRKTKVKE